MPAAALRSRSRVPPFSQPVSSAYSRKISAGLAYSNAADHPLAAPMRLATSASCHQSGRASPGDGMNARCREMRRSELVTVPFFSPQAAAGSSTWASAVVSVCRATSETTTSGHRARAARTALASGMLSTGFVAMIQIALIRPSATARNISTAFMPGFSAMRGEPQNVCTMRRCPALSRSMWAASMLASPPVSRPPMAFGWPVTENGPMPGLPMRPVARWQLMIALTLSVPAVDWLTPWL